MKDANQNVLLLKNYSFIWLLMFFFVVGTALGLCCCRQTFSSCGKQRLPSGTLWLLIAVASLVAECGLVGVHGFSSCGAQALLPCSMWDLSGPRMEPMSPALAGGFLAPRPLEKSGLFLIAASI